MSSQQFNYLQSTIAQCQADQGTYRSKVAQLPDPIPVKAPTLRDILRDRAAKKALRAHRRHGEDSYQFKRAMNSRWLRDRQCPTCGIALGKSEARCHRCGSGDFATELKRAYHATTIQDAVDRRAA